MSSISNPNKSGSGYWGRWRSLRFTVLASGTGIVLVSSVLGAAWFKDRAIRRAHERAYSLYPAWPGARDTPASLAETIHRGNAIVDALDRYRAANHAYPEWLSDLVPTCMPALPRPVYGPDEDWYYAPTDDGSFQLSFRSASDHEDDGVRVEVRGRITRMPRWLYVPSDHDWVEKM